MKKVIKASTGYEKWFWDLHDKDMETGMALEGIVDSMGLGDEFFPDEGGDPTATEEEYKQVLDAYKNQPSTYTLIYTVLEHLVDKAGSIDGVTSCYFDDDTDSIRITVRDKSGKRARFNLVLEEG